MSTPREFHDFSAVDQYFAAPPIRAVAERRLKTGAGVLAGGIGVAAVLAAGSLWVRPEVVHDVAVTEKVVEVKVPVITEKVITVDKPIVTERVIQAPAPMPKPAQPTQEKSAPPIEPGQKMTEDQFRQSSEFKESHISGQIVSIKNGSVRFDNGNTFDHLNPDGTLNKSISSHIYDGEWAYCDFKRIDPVSRKERWKCNVLAGGQIHDVFGSLMKARFGTSPTPHPSDNPFEDLF